MLDFSTKPILGMIHCAGGKDAVSRAFLEIGVLELAGFAGVIVENYHNDIETVEEILKQDLEKRTRVTLSKPIEVGINILPNDFKKAFELADKYGASFIQLDVIAGVYGKSTFNLTEYEKYRTKYSHIQVLGGVWPKYYVPIKGSDLNYDLQQGMLRCDAIVVTGKGTGMETPIGKIETFRKIIGNFPLIVGAGLNADNVKTQLKIADGGIVGSCLKIDGNTNNMLDISAIKKFIDSIL